FAGGGAEYLVVLNVTIIGSIKTTNVTIDSRAEVHGDGFHDTLSIEAGAIIAGSLTHRHEEDNVSPIMTEDPRSTSIRADDDSV
ncbi:hypothetical protein CWB79_22680, partial [Pseudoalteromonas sp. S1649]